MNFGSYFDDMASMEHKRLPQAAIMPAMRLRYSLRSFLIAVALFAAFCYAWLIRPARVGEQFVTAIKSADYAEADRLFRSADYEFFGDDPAQKWEFEARSEVLPCTFSQLLTGRRYVVVDATYFEFDASVSRQSKLVATPLGLNVPNLTTIRYEPRIIGRQAPALVP